MKCQYNLMATTFSERLDYLLLRRINFLDGKWEPTLISAFSVIFMNRCKWVSREPPRFILRGGCQHSVIRMSQRIFFLFTAGWSDEHLSNLWLSIVQSTSLHDAQGPSHHYKVSGAALWWISDLCHLYCTVYSGVQCPAQTWEAVAHQLERTQHIWIMQTGPCQLEKRWDPLRKWLSTANISRMWPPMSQ